MTDTTAQTTQPSVNIRAAQESELAAIQAFIEPFVDSGDVMPRTIGELAELLPTCFVADLNGQIVGCAILEIYSWKLAEIRSLCVSQQVQGQGVGKRLVTACVDLAHERKVLEVMAITHSEEFFRACGFDYTLPSLRKALFLQTRDDI